MDNLIQLLTDFRNFTKDTGSDSFILFGEWLKQKYTSQENYSSDEPGVNQAGLDVIASYLLGGLASYIDVWVKLTYEGLPIISLGDFGILMAVEYWKRPSKKDIAGHAIMEHSTCIESIKRLIKAGLLQEETDEKDKRIKRVTLTHEGQELIKKLNQKMISLSTLLMGNLTDVEKKSMIPALKKLNDFHHNLYRKKEEIDIKKLYNL